MTYLTNAFSLQMLPLSQEALVRVEPIDTPELVNTEFVSAIGHADTAAVVADILGVDVPANRVNVSLGQGDTLIVAQLLGGRLPEGATKLPEGFSIKFVRVTLA